MQLLLRLVYPLAILTVHNEHETLGAGVVVPPQWPDLVLPSYVPHVELDILVRDSLHVEAHCESTRKQSSSQSTRHPRPHGTQRRTRTCWDSSDRLVQLQLVQDSFDTRGVSIRKPQTIVIMGYTANSLVFPAASRPSISNLISLFPKILPTHARRENQSSMSPIPERALVATTRRLPCVLQALRRE